MTMTNLVGRTLGSYKIIEEIGHGGLVDVDEGKPVEDIYATAVEAYVSPPAFTASPTADVQLDAPRLSTWAWIAGATLLVGGLALTGCFGGGGEEPPIEESSYEASEEEPAAEEATAEPTEEFEEAEIAIELPALAFEGVAHNIYWEPIIQDFDGVQMALVPVGCSVMGRAAGVSDERPDHEVCFDEPFWIDVYEVTNAQYGSAASDCMEWSSGDDRPRICVDWYEAAAHCESRGARLPTEAEWEYVARGPTGLSYSWGHDFVGDNVVYWETSGGQTADVGSRPGGVSWVGTYDMSGNVWEWVSDWYDEDYYGTLPDPAINPQGPSSGEYRVLRGGSWFSGGLGLRAADRNRFDPDSTNFDYGIRCARDY